MLPEVSKLNHSLKNKKQEDQIQISPEKELYVEKERKIYNFSTHHTGRWIVL